ncbi:MAG TPA: ATP-binding cassette domain-containing protein, partial [Rhodopila sp.]
MITDRPLLEVNVLKKHFPIHGGLLGQVTAKVYAVDGVTFSINRGETLSLVGESGCGKSTVGKAILRLFKLTDGEVYLDGERIDNMPARKLRMMRQRVQVVFQDPFSSLNPRMRVHDILAEPIVNFGLAKSRAELDERVGA